MPAADLPALDALDQAVAGHESRLITSSVLRFAPALGVGAEEVYSVHVQTDDGRFSAELGGGDMYESLGYMGCLRAVLDLASGAEPAVAWEVSRRVIRTTVRAAQLARLSGTTDARRTALRNTALPR